MYLETQCTLKRFEFSAYFRTIILIKWMNKMDNNKFNIVFHTFCFLIIQMKHICNPMYLTNVIANTIF